MYSTCILGASGYTGAELAKILWAHPDFSLDGCFVSAQSADAGKRLGEVHGALSHVHGIEMQALSDDQVQALGELYDLIFMALPHEVSHHWAQQLRGTKAIIFDLSGAFRLSDAATFEHYYGFAHAYPDLLEERVYGLAEWHASEIANAKQLIAVPGCYPTASMLALKPLTSNHLLSTKQLPVINATSGVSGAGRKASMTSSFFEVSLQAYGVHTHRHTPEIEEFSDTKVIFTPHLGAFKRGILATVTAFVEPHVSAQDITKAFHDAYDDKPLVRLCTSWPKVDNVAHTPFCDIHWAFDEQKQCVIVTAAIDNLLKGAASQAIQCANIRFALNEAQGLLP
jgi:N-acetyl-gamma-glutamyl-phosphate reductase